jgi:hypothetical protein
MVNMKMQKGDIHLVVLYSCPGTCNTTRSILQQDNNGCINLQGRASVCIVNGWIEDEAHMG